MAINSINNYTQPIDTTSGRTASSAKQTAKKASSDSTASTGVIYEKSSDTTATKSTKSDYKTQNASLIAQMKADTNNRVQQLQNIVSQMMTKQGNAIGTADNMWRFLASGNFTVTAAAKAQAQQDISEDGYWGVEQTSDRIVDFAKALSGSNPDKADELLNAFKKGFSQATKSWGGKLPDISQRTYDAVVKKFDDWKNETKTASANEANA